MFKKVSFMVCLFLFTMSATMAAGPVPAAAPVPPRIHAKTAVLMVADTHQVLFDKKKDAIMYPASTTKIMTLLTALQHGNLDGVVTVSPKAAAVGESSLGVNAGDRLTLRNLLTGMILVSGNDAAEAVAEYVGGGSSANFIAMMNAEAQRLGADRTHFSNPHGLPDPNHYTTAYDMALITAKAYQYPEFRRIVATKEYDVQFLNRPPLHVENIDRMLRIYPGANGVKTGFTNAAGDCLVAGAKRDGVQLIAVLYNDDYRWEDAKALLDYGFAKLNEGKVLWHS
jgi:D-alanyl-D-alanine carboxypeptidase (penicillin-binding protein 5/6)